MEQSAPLLPDDAYSTDNPIFTKLEDEFDRYEYAKRIAYTICQRKAQDSLAVALYARWGEGKTSVLNLIERALPSKDIITVLFNPWRFLGEAQLLMGFFAEFAKALDISLRAGATKDDDEFRQYSHIALTQGLLMRAVSSVADMPSPTIDTFVEQAALEGLKRKIEEQLVAAKKRVVVIIDDIDRLTKVEIQALFRLIKLTADFRYTTYLLAFDESMVAKAIGEMYEGGDEAAGRSFLEKIIQVPLRLPAIQPDVMLRFFIDKVNKVLQVAQVDISQEDGGRFASAARSSIVPMLKVPRQVIRYCNAIGFILPLLDGEANPADIMLIEALKLFYPQIYALIADNQQAVTGTKPDNGQDTYLHEQLDTVFGSDGSKIGTVRNLIYTLFPRVESAYTKVANFSFFSNKRVRYDTELEEYKLVASPNYFKRYFSYAVQPGELPDRRFSNLLDIIKQGNEEAIYQEANSLLEQVDIKELVRRIKQLPLKIAIANATSICKLYGRLSNKLAFDSTSVIWHLGESYQIVKSIIGILEGVTSSERLPTIVNLIRDSTSLNFSRVLLHDLEQSTVATTGSVYNDETEEEVNISQEPLITSEEYKKLTRIFVDRVLREAGDDAVFETSLIDGEEFLLYTWPQVEEPSVIQRYVHEKLSQHPEKLLLLLRSLSTKVSSNFGPHVPARISAGQYEQIRTILDAAYLYDLGLRALDGKPVNPPKSERRNNITDDERLHQFMYHHQQFLHNAASESQKE